MADRAEADFRERVSKVTITTEYKFCCQGRLENVGARVMSMTDAEAGRWIKAKVMEALESGQGDERAMSR